MMCLRQLDICKSAGLGEMKIRILRRLCFKAPTMTLSRARMTFGWFHAGSEESCGVYSDAEYAMQTTSWLHQGLMYEVAPRLP